MGAKKKGLSLRLMVDPSEDGRRILKPFRIQLPNQMGPMVHSRIQWVKGQWVKRGQRTTTKGFRLGAIRKFLVAIRKFGVPYPIRARAHARVNLLSNLLCRIQLTTLKPNDQYA